MGEAREGAALTFAVKLVSTEPPLPLAAAERQHLVAGQVALVHQQPFVGVHDRERPVVDTDVDRQVLTSEADLEPY